MNGNGRIGMEGTGRLDRSSSDTLRATVVAESHASRRDIRRPSGFRSTYERKTRNRKLSMLIVCAAAMVLMSGLAIAQFGLPNAGGKQSARTQVLPVAAFTTVVSPATTVSVDASGSTGTGLTYAWNFGDNWTSTGLTRSHYYMSTADYTVNLTVTDDIGQTASVSHVVSIVNNAVPPFPYTIFGTTFASDGTTPEPNCAVNITVVDTGFTFIGTVSDVDGLYSCSALNALYVVDGYTLTVTATHSGGLSGSNSGIVDQALPYLGIDVTLTSVVIPEFTVVVIPIVGMLSIVAVARVLSGRSKEE